MAMHPILLFLALGVGSAMSQTLPLPTKQSTAWNSTFELTLEQLRLGKLTESEGDTLNTIINFDRSQLANGGPHEDGFYNVQNIPTGQLPTEPGKVIKLQEFTDPSPYSIPPKTAMSRIIYTTTNANGTLVPASAYVLWPYQPKKFQAGRNNYTSMSPAPAVLWTHGTSGFYASGAPSTHRALFYADFVPFALAESGYAVVAPDYAGLGVGTSWDGTPIPHQYFVREAGAGDALNAMRAALETFPDHLSHDYVVMGHSQGGAVAWGLSEILGREDHVFKDIAKGHLGTVLAAPPTDVFSVEAAAFLAWIGKDLDKIYPEFDLGDWFTPLGVSRTELLNQVEGSQFVSMYLFQAQSNIVQPDWRETPFVKAFEHLANAGRKPFKGPMLLLHGTEDPVVPYNTTVATMEDTCMLHPGDLELLIVTNAGHFPVMSAAQQTWLKWIDDRFEGRPVAKHGCIQSTLNSFRPLEHYQALPSSFLQWAGQPQWSYELPTAA